MGEPKALGWKQTLGPVFSASYKLSIVVHTNNHITGEMEAEGPGQRIKFEAGLGMRVGREESFNL